MTKITDKRADPKITTQEYELVSGSYSTFDDEGNRVKLRKGDRIHLSPEKAKKLVNIVRPVVVPPVVETTKPATEPAKPAETTKPAETKKEESNK